MVKKAKRKSSKMMKAKQFATINETCEFKDLEPNTSLALCFDLAKFPRAGQVATNFKWYKATKVTWTMTPLFNLYADNGGDTTPYLYTVMNRTQDSLLVNLADIQAQGAKPQKLIGTKVKSYVPNWCSPGLTTFTKDLSGGFITGATQQGLRCNYGWLASPDSVNLAPSIGSFITPIDPREPPPVPAAAGMNSVNANQVLYNGHYIFIDQTNVTGVTTVARLTANVTWEFKDPKFHAFVRDPVPVQPKLA